MIGIVAVNGKVASKTNVPAKKKKVKKFELEGPSILEMLDRLEAEMARLRAENNRLAPKGKAPALGKGLSQLLGGPRRA
jgi:hypothetical protein